MASLTESFRAGLAEMARTLAGASAYQNAEPRAGTPIDDDSVAAIREAMGGQIQPLPVVQTRWLLADLEDITIRAARGDLSRLGQLWAAMQRDGYIRGLGRTRTAGLLSLPKIWRGEPDQIDELRSEGDITGQFDSMCPVSELGRIAADGIGMGIGVGILDPVEGRDWPVLIRLDPQNLQWIQNEQRWYYRSIGGLLPITPGDGRWVLHIPGARLDPTSNAEWQSLGRAFVLKEHAMLHRGNFGGKLANPARVAQAPQAATEEQRAGFLSRLIAWGINTCIELPPGWEAKILESNGRGWEVFGTDIDTSNQEIMISLAGQFVTVTGGTGFANADVHETIRADLIKLTADEISHTVNTQIIPPWAWNRAVRLGMDPVEAVASRAYCYWDIRPPVDRKAEAEALSATAKAIDDLSAAMAKYDLQPDVEEILNRMGAPIKLGPNGEPEPPVEGAEPEPPMPPGMPDNEPGKLPDPKDQGSKNAGKPPPKKPK